MRLFLIAAAMAALATAAQAQPGPGHRPANLDRDGDGKITLSEFQAAHAERGTRMFARLDADNDGKIIQAEAQAMPRRDGPGGGHGPHGPGGGMLMRMDANGDGAVTRAELDAGATRRFQMADANKDGWLSADEQAKMQPKGRGGQGPR